MNYIKKFEMVTNFFESQILQLCKSDENLKKIKKILNKKNINLNFQNSDGDFALLLASRYGSIEIVKELLKHNININLQNKDNETSLHEGVVYPKITKLLVDYGAKLDISDRNGMTPLIRAVYSDIFNSCVILIDNGADVNAQDRLGNTSLIFSIKRNPNRMPPNLNIFSLLTINGADWQIENSHNKNIFSYLNEIKNLNFKKNIIEKFPLKYKQYLKVKKAKKYNIL